MKEANLQFDNLTTLILKNLNDDYLFNSPENFEIVYQKIIQQAFKAVGIVFENVIRNQTLTESFNKFMKQLKNFSSLKPQNLQDDDSEYFNEQFDEVKQFLNNRKPVISEVETNQRGQIYKFLCQVEKKEKDTQQFINNLSKFNNKQPKTITQNSKNKKTIKSIEVTTKQFSIQTNLNFYFFQKLQKKLPTLFQLNLDANNEEKFKEFNYQDIYLTDQIEKKLEMSLKLMQEQKLQDQHQIFSQEKQQKIQKEIQKEKDIKHKENFENKKKKSAKVKENSNRNLKSLGASASSNRNIQKDKSGFKTNKKQTEENLGEDGLIISTQDQSIEQNKSNQDLVQQEQSITEKQSKIKEEQKQKFHQTFPSLEKICKAFLDFQGLNQQQMKKIYEYIKLWSQQNLENNPNSEILHELKICADQRSNIMTSTKQINTLISFSTLNDIDNELKLLLCKNQIQGVNDNKNEVLNKVDQEQLNLLQKKNVQIKSQMKNQLSNLSNNGYFNFRNTQYSAFQKAELPLINKKPENSNLNKLKCDTHLIEERKPAEQNLKKIKNIKDEDFKSKPSTKQNYSLDMYKAKKDPNRNRTFQSINLPGLKSSHNRYPINSLHQEQNKLSNNRLNKQQIRYQSVELNLKMEEAKNSKEPTLRKAKNDKIKNFSKQEERIMQELKRISRQNLTKANIKSISMYVQFIQQMHLRKCGQKCAHLQRFYQFMQNNNLPARKSFILPKTDMNIIFQI